MAFVQPKQQGDTTVIIIFEKEVTRQDKQVISPKDKQVISPKDKRRLRMRLKAILIVLIILISLCWIVNKGFARYYGHYGEIINLPENTEPSHSPPPGWVEIWVSSDGHLWTKLNSDVITDQAAGKGVTVYGSDGSSFSGASNVAYEPVVGGTSTTIVPDGKGGATVYYGVPSAGGGSGLTTIQTSNGTEAEAALLGDAAGGIFVIGAQGVGSTATGNTVIITADGVHTQVSNWGVSKVTDWTGVPDAAIDHDQTTNFAANEHIDWTAGSAGTIHTDNYIENPFGAAIDTGEITDGTITENDINFGSGATLSGVSAWVVNVNIFNPDDCRSAVSENIAIYKVDRDKFPDGIILDSIWVQQFGVTDYIVVVEEWAGNHPSHDNDIESMAIAGAAEYKETRYTNIDHRVIEADHWIFLDIPTTASDQLFLKLKGRIR